MATCGSTTIPRNSFPESTITKRTTITGKLSPGMKILYEPEQSGFTVYGGPANAASLSFPTGVAVNADGSLYIADHYHSTIRKVSSAGLISTIAGQALTRDFTGDGGPAANATLNLPYAVAL